MLKELIRWQSSYLRSYFKLLVYVLKKQNITGIVCSSFWVVSRLFKVQSTRNVRKMMNLTTFAICMSPPVTIQHRHLLFELKKHIEGNNNEEVHSTRHSSRILSKRYGPQGSKEANSIVTYTILDSSVGAAAEIVKESLGDDQQTKLTEGTDISFIHTQMNWMKYQHHWKLSLVIFYSKSRTETTEKKKELQKIGGAYTSVQFCKNEGHLSPYGYWTVRSQCRDHDFW